LTVDSVNAGKEINSTKKGLSKTALRNLPEKALSSENVQFIDTVDDSRRSIANYFLMLSFFAVAFAGKF
jgi:hypothetical protein